MDLLSQGRQLCLTHHCEVKTNFSWLKINELWKNFTGIFFYWILIYKYGWFWKCRIRAKNPELYIMRPPQNGCHHNDFRYHQISNISCTKFQNLNVSRLALQMSLSKPLTPDVQVENGDVVGDVPTGDAPTTSAWQTILLPTMVRLILESWRYIFLRENYWIFIQISQKFVPMGPIQ